MCGSDIKQQPSLHLRSPCLFHTCFSGYSVARSVSRCLAEFRLFLPLPRPRYRLPLSASLFPQTRQRYCLSHCAIFPEI